MFKAGEKAKSLNTVNFYLNTLLLKNFNRSDLVIAIGGGITGDMVGFVSSIYKRGIKLYKHTYNTICLKLTLLLGVKQVLTLSMVKI